MMKKLILLILSYFLLSPSIVYAQTVKDVYASLKLLEAKTEVGVSPVEYLSLLGDSWFKAKMFFSSQEAEKLPPQLKESLAEAIKKYKKAASIWNLQLDADGLSSIDHMARKGFLFADSSYGKKVKEIMPEALPLPDGKKKSFYAVKILLFDLWRDASLDLQKEDAFLP